MIDPSLVEQYQRDGAVCVRQLFRPHEIDALRAGIDLNLANLSPRAIIASAADDPGRFVEDFCNWQVNAHYHRFIFGSALADQDQPYYNIEGRQNVSFWIPVDPVSRESTLELVAGSHLGPWLMPRSFMDAEARWFPEGTLADLPDIDAAREKFPILGWDLQPGDAVCFHMLMLHGARGVSGSQRRRVFSVRFLGDDIRHTPRRWKTSPDFPGLASELPVGAPMNHPLFPMLWCSQP
jgi:hypothetical protein